MHCLIYHISCKLGITLSLIFAFIFTNYRNIFWFGSLCLKLVDFYALGYRANYVQLENIAGGYKDNSVCGKGIW